MPPHSRLTTLIDSLRTRSTNTTRALGRLFANPAAYRESDLATRLGDGGVLNTLEDWARTLLSDQGLSDGEIDHIDDWPPEQKEEVRAALLGAIEARRRVRFHWELHRGDQEETDIESEILPDQSPRTPDLIITFKTPYRRLVAISDTEVMIGVGD